VTLTGWALVVLFAFAAGLCLWAGLTGRPDSAPTPQHAAWGETTVLDNAEPDGDRTQVLRTPTPRWYDENPWPYGRPHGWGETRD
jgi:hypothetical protein